MGKIAKKYLEENPWKIIENGFHSERSLVSESLFSLANEYMGMRGFFEEGYDKNSLIGTYYNGVYEKPKDVQTNHYKGISEKNHYMVNGSNFLYFRLYINDELYVFDENSVTDYQRILDFKTGESTRSYKIKDLLEITFKRVLDMNIYQVAHQQIQIKPIKYHGNIKIELGIDFSTQHWNKPGFWEVVEHRHQSSVGKTTTNQKLSVSYQVDMNLDIKSITSYHNKLNIETFSFDLAKEVIINKTILSLIDKNEDEDHIKTRESFNLPTYQESIESNKKFYEIYWKRNDIIIEGDLENQQGIRYCLFQLVNTYQGLSEKNNIGAKGLTGEAYSGHAFWDSETYVLPVYLFTNMKAAKNLLMFRYNTLMQARSRAIELDCKGACYPIATLNGDEACDLWQHASLQFQPTSGVSYAIWHYMNNSDNEAFLIQFGFEMLLEVARFFSSRGQYNSDHTKFGYYSVMGPDEFEMMVNHNTYTNYMAKKSMEYFIDSYHKHNQHPEIINLLSKLDFKEEELSSMIEKCDHMYIPFDQTTKLFEQHDGFYDLPHINIHDIPVTDFPLYSNWSYDRIYRNDVIKQPDVLMFLFLYNSEFDLSTKKANYDYYEPKTIHESSLSPSIHSIFATELGYKKQALDFFSFATRMDLDDYNRNTSEGLHLTSIAAAWINIVYGFGGLRSDAKILRLAPVCPISWESYIFNIEYFGVNINIKVSKTEIILSLDQDLLKPIQVFDQVYYLEKGMKKIYVGN
ncbi:MAG: glycosyl hydrolase family 65 protein [Acholeplasmataceae bacterium]